MYIDRTVIRIHKHQRSHVSSNKLGLTCTETTGPSPLKISSILTKRVLSSFRTKETANGNGGWQTDLKKEREASSPPE